MQSHAENIVGVKHFTLSAVKVYIPVPKIYIFFLIWKGHVLEVHCTDIQLKIFTK